MKNAASLRDAFAVSGELRGHQPMGRETPGAPALPLLGCCPARELARAGIEIGAVPALIGYRLRSGMMSDFADEDSAGSVSALEAEGCRGPGCLRIRRRLRSARGGSDRAGGRSSRAFTVDAGRVSPWPPPPLSAAPRIEILATISALVFS